VNIPEKIFSSDKCPTGKERASNPKDFRDGSNPITLFYMHKRDRKTDREKEIVKRTNTRDCSAICPWAVAFANGVPQ
jgi:hypothetical protein